MKRQIRLTESDIRRMVMEALNELGENSDPELNRQTTDVLNRASAVNRRGSKKHNSIYDLMNDNTTAAIEELCNIWKEENCDAEGNLINKKNIFDYRTPAYYALVQAVTANADGQITHSRNGSNSGRRFDQRFFMYDYYSRIVKQVKYSKNFSRTGKFISPEEYDELPDNTKPNYIWSDAKRMYEETIPKEGAFNLNDVNSVRIFEMMSDAIECAMTDGVAPGSNDGEAAWYNLKDENGNLKDKFTEEERYNDYYNRRKAYYKNQGINIDKQNLADEGENDEPDEEVKSAKRKFKPSNMVVPVIYQAKTILSSGNVFKALKTHLFRQCEQYIDFTLDGEDRLRMNQETFEEPRQGQEGANPTIDPNLTSRISGVDDMDINDIRGRQKANPALAQIKRGFEFMANKNVETMLTAEEYNAYAKQAKDKKNPRAAEIKEWLDGFVPVPYTEYDDAPNGEEGLYYVEPIVSFEGSADKVKDGNIIAIAKYIYHDFDTIFSRENIQRCLGTVDANSNENSDSQFYKLIKQMVNEYVHQANIPTIGGGTIQPSKSGKSPLMDAFWAMFSNIFHTKSQVQDDEATKVYRTEHPEDKKGNVMKANPKYEELKSIRDRFNKEATMEARRRKLINKIVSETIHRHLRNL